MSDHDRRPDDAQQPYDADHTQDLPATASGDPAGPPPPRDSEDTTPLWFGAPYAPAEPVAQEPRPRSGRRLAAAVLVGALVLGGAAGVGGAAAYDAFDGDDASSPASTPSDYEATSTSVVEDGTVESVADAVLPSVVKINVASGSGAGSGSGIVLSDDGEILTNNHVVESAEGGGSISVSFADGSTAAAEIVGTDPLVDIAVIKVEPTDDLTPASIGQSSDLDVGQSVVAIGSPFGLDATVTTGIVSALNRPVSISSEQQQETPPFGAQPQQQAPQSTTYPAIQTDAAINPGNSGGPLVDMSGRVVGINSSIRGSSSASGQSGSIGLGFAIPMDEVLPIVNQLVEGETPTHARLGVSVSDPQASESGQGPATGALVSQVEGGAAADLAGLQEGDVVTRVDDVMIDGADSLVATIRGHRPGDEVIITLLREGEEQTVQTELGSDSGQPTS